MKPHSSTLLSLVLVLSMLLSCGGFTAYAEITTAQTVTATGDGNVNNVSIADDIHVTDPGNVTAATVTAASNAEALLALQGEISAVSTNGNATALDITAIDGGSAAGKIQEGVSAESASGDATALHIDASYGGDITAEILGNAEATAPAGTATGIGSIGLISGAAAEISLTGDVIASGDSAYGIIDTIDNDASFDITVDGNVDVTGTSLACGIDLPQIPGSPIPVSNDTTVHVTGDVTVESQGTALGMHIVSDGKTDASVIVDQDVSAVGDLDATGMVVSAMEDGSADITVGGDLTVRSADNHEVSGIDARASDQGTIDIDVEGEVNVEGYGTGIYAFSEGDAETEINVGGPVTVTGAAYVAGVTMNVSDGNVKANIGALTVTSESYSQASAINIDMTNGTAQLEVDGDVQTNGFGINITMAEQGTGTSEVIVHGDLNAGVYGVQALTQIDSDVVSDILVDGTLNGDEHAIVINEMTTKDNLKVTVYEIKLDEDGNAVVGKNSPGETYVNGNTRELESSIMYIIKVQQPSEGATLTAVKEDGSPLDQSHGLDVAREGDVVLMRVDVAPGYHVTGAYSVDGHELDIYEKDGQYYVEVPKGGGVYISARVEKDEKRNFSLTDYVPVSESSSASVTGTGDVQYVDVTFEFNGGHKPASLFAGPVVKTVPAGTWVVLIDAPVREGADFLYWESDQDSVTVSKPGENFRAMESVTFTAIWSDQPSAEEDAEGFAAAETTGDAAAPSAEPEVPGQKDASVITEEDAAAAEAVAVREEAADTADEAAQPVSTSSAAEEDDVPVREAEEDAVPAEEADNTKKKDTASVLSLDSSNAAAIALTDLLSGDGGSLQAKLIIDLGDGNSLEIPVDIQLSLGTPTIVTTSA